MHLQRWYQVLSFMLSLLGRSSPYHTYRSSLALRNRHIYQQMSSAVDNGSTIVSNAIVVKERALSAAFSVGRSPETIRLVAVSKTKPADNIKELYDAGFRAFGENYFQELVEKAQTLPKDIKWHFIGHLQSSKASKLIKEVPNLAVLETVDSAKLAGKLNNACVQAGRPSLDVFIQVDTSGEETKSGVTAGAELDELLQLVRDSCPRLRVAGLMTIGAPGDMGCFDQLALCRESAAATLGVPVQQLELSMGMSGDFEEAIRRGATSVRVGSTIFGPRLYPPSKAAAGEGSS